MNYLGTVKIENGHLLLPDGFRQAAKAESYEAVEIDGDILLSPTPLDRKRLERIDELALASIADHRKSLEGLAK